MGIFLFSLLWIMYHNYVIRRRNEDRLVYVTILSIISIIGFSVLYYVFDNFFIGLLFVSFTYITYTDISYYLIYNSINVGVFIINLMYVILHENYINYVLNMFVLFVIFGIFSLIMRLVKKELIGGGDLKLIVAMTGFVRGLDIFYVLFMSSFICLIIYMILLSKIKKKKEIFFGPFLCNSYFLYLILKQIFL